MKKALFILTIIIGLFLSQRLTYLNLSSPALLVQKRSIRKKVRYILILRIMQNTILRLSEMGADLSRITVRKPFPKHIIFKMVKRPHL